jgi:hypothetical protein
MASRHRKEENMRKIVIMWFGLVLFGWAVGIASEKDFEIQGKKLISQKPPFIMSLPSELPLVHSSSRANPTENSLTRAYYLVKAKEKEVEEMLIVEIADKTNPQAGLMTTPPLKPFIEKRMYLKDRIKRGELRGDYLIQLMAWNPDASSLQFIVKKGIMIPSRWALQGQFLFVYQGEHAVFIRYAKNVNSFGLKISEEWKDWERESISGNEKKAYETFHKSFMEMIQSIKITTL